ncbi:TlpA disulfide reductase family protein [Ascidiimonas aurantiaca]|uniref:TlpA family protein disulfide reductase n=1 Tax=Ascidiimonas aurantiaca TaxID=1685432 RepID=UPI0030EB2A92
MKSVVLIVFLVILYGCKSEERKEVGYNAFSVIPEDAPKQIIRGENRSLKVYDFEGFEHMLSKQDDKIYIINFWATWCKPCVAELPFFEEITEKYSAGNVEVVLVSLDMPRMFETHLLPFVEKRDLKSNVIVLDDPRQNDWIPKVSEEWSGAIPATLVYRNSKKEFYERSLEYEELETIIEKFKNH